MFAPTQVHKAIEIERRKWEAEKEEALQVQSELLQKQTWERLESVRSEMEREKSNVVTLQNKVTELQAV